MSLVQDYITVPLETVPTDVVLPYGLHVRLSERLVLLRNRGDVLTMERVTQLRQKNVEALYIDHLDWSLFMDGIRSELDKLGKDAVSEAAMMGVRTVLFSYWKTLEGERQVSASVFTGLKEMTARIPLAIQKDRNIASKMVRRYNDPSVYFANHSVNTTIYSVAMGMKIGMNITQLQELALAACLANVGIVRTPPEILYKPGELTPEEMAKVREHPRTGADLLKLILVPPECIKTALMHHERMDGSGYPGGLSGEAIHLYARVVAIAECYSALTNARPWAPAMSPVEAVKKMSEMKGRFDPRIMPEFTGG